MKISNLAIAFILIVTPFFFIMDLRTSALSNAEILSDQYDAALKTANQDAAVMLNFNELQEYEAGYYSEKNFKANKELALNTFFRSLYLSFGVEDDPVGQGTLRSYIPVIVVTDYDGYWIYAMDEYEDETGQVIYKHMWKPKKPYAFTDSQGNVFNFSLDGYTRVYQASTETWLEGWQQDLAGNYDIDLLDNKESFEMQRRSTIVDSIQNDLAHVINKHNEYASKNGISYMFTLPYIPEEDWTNTINDIGIISFIQGIPIGEKFYNNYAFGSGRLIKNPVIIGGIDENTGIKYYYRNTCSFPYKEEETFSSEQEAAASGYFPKSCLNGE